MFWWFLTLMVIWMGFHVYFVESLKRPVYGSHYEHHPSQQKPSWMTFRQTWRSKFVFFLNIFIRDFIEILATKKKGDIGKKLRDISRGCHIIRDDWEPRKRMLMMMTTMAFQWRICRLGLLSGQDLVYDGSFVSYEMPSSIIQLRVGWRSWWWP